MRRRRNKRYLKKRLRRREKQLGAHLGRFLDGFDSKQPLEEESNFHLLLHLRWLVNDFLYLRLKLHRGWREGWFLDLFDVVEVKTNGEGVELTGDIVWWVEGKGAETVWIPADHEPRQIGVHKIKIRGDMRGGRGGREPGSARLARA